MHGDIDIYLLARNMDTSVARIEAHYGHDDPAFRAGDVIQDKKIERLRASTPNLARKSFK